jgi:hypothetical protein
MKKYALVNLQGGLGNQIFQIAYALYLKSLNMTTIVDTHFYSSNMQFPRKLEIVPNEFGLNSIKFKNLKLFDKFDTLFGEINTFNHEDFKIFNRFVGYYQDFQILNYSKHIIQNKLQLGEGVNDENKVAVHIRRGDYMGLQQNLTDIYYKNAINKMFSINPDSVLDIYTDAEDLNLNPKIFKNINHIYKSDTNFSSTETIKSMSEYSNYIIANSSFSALAAFFSNSLEKKVIYPYPWWRDSNISIQSIPTNWIAIDNKL